jgi:hypothetical protein
MDIIWWLGVPGAFAVSWISTLFAPSITARLKARKEERLNQNETDSSLDF